MARNYVTSDKPGQRDDISAIDVDWNSRKGRFLGDVSSSEEGRRPFAKPLSRQQIGTIVFTEKSLYIMVRLEYDDTKNDCGS